MLFFLNLAKPNKVAGGTPEVTPSPTWGVQHYLGYFLGSCIVGHVMGAQHCLDPPSRGWEQ
jgi:hypothetical protein